MEILVVGAGLSGSLAAFFLREALPDAKVHVWDGARGVGGRLATARFGDGDSLRANMGAQELHYAEDGGAGEAAARALLEAGVASREGPGVLFPAGDSNAVCRRLVEAAELRFGARVKEVRAADGGFVATAFGGAPRRFDGVVFAGSVAELATTHGSIDALVRPFRGDLRTVRYTRQACAALAFGRSVRRHFGGARTLRGAGAVERLVLQENDAVVVAVSTTAYGASITGLRATHRPTPKDLAVKEQVLKAMTEAAALGGEAPVASKLNYWKFSRCVCGLDRPFLELCPGFCVVGDYFNGGSTLGGCAASARAAAAALARALAAPPPPPAPRRRRRVLVCGAGATGALVARGCREFADVEVWEGARGCGGRMSTTRWAPDGGDEIRANVGAQLLHATSPEAVSLLRDAGAAGEGGVFEPPALGAASVVKRLLDGVACRFSTRLGELAPRAGGWLATPRGAAAAEVFDAVVLAMPPSDAARVRGVPGLEIALKWRSCFALSLWWADSTAAAAFADALHGTSSRDVARARRQKNAAGVAVTIHSTPEFWGRFSRTNAGGGRGGGAQAGGGRSSGKGVAGGGREAVQRALTAAAEAIAGPCPAPDHVKLLNWRTGQVCEYDGALSHDLGGGLLLCGDWAAGASSFEACFRSARAATAAVRGRFEDGEVEPPKRKKQRRRRGRKGGRGGV